MKKKIFLDARWRIDSGRGVQGGGGHQIDGYPIVQARVLEAGKGGFGCNLKAEPTGGKQ